MNIKKGVLRFKSSEELVTLTKNKNIDIYNYIFNKIKVAFLLDISHIFMFEFLENGITVKIQRNEWISPLEKCLKKYEECEEYELCKECIIIIEEIKKSL